MDYRTYIAEKINVEGMSAGEIRELLMTPPDPKMGDFCLPCFKLAKTLRKPPQAIAEPLCGQIAADRVIASCEAVSGYLNVRLNKAEAVKDLLNEILSAGDDYGKSDIGKGKTVCIDYSSINIAKPFHIGHLSTTVLGGALYRIFKSLGYRTVGINHLGDYGTQFGKLIVALKRWGDTVDLPVEISCTAEEYAAAIGLDKKGAGADISVILLEEMGRAIPHKMPKAALLEELK